MSLNSLHLDAFQACAQAGTFTKAAERLHITQSALSQRIQNLEEEIQTTLFVREKSGVRLTEFGEELLRYCQTRESFEAELLQRVTHKKGGQLGGVLRVGSFSSVARSIILPLLSDLLAKNPAVHLKLFVREVYDLEPMLRSGEIDFLVTTSEIKKQGIESYLLGYEENVLTQKKGYKGPEIFLDHDENDPTTRAYTKKTAAQLQRRYLDDVYGLIDGMRLGIGRAIVPVHMVSDFKDVEILDSSKRLRIPVVLHYHTQPIYSQLHQKVIEALKKPCALAAR